MSEMYSYYCAAQGIALQYFTSTVCTSTRTGPPFIEVLTAHNDHVQVSASDLRKGASALPMPVSLVPLRWEREYLTGKETWARRRGSGIQLICTLYSDRS